MSARTLSLTIVAACCCRVLASLPPTTVEKLAASYGYHDDTHNVVTPDGYILTVHRLSKPDALNSSRHNSPILLGHGLLTSSEQWIFRQDGNLALQLVDNGFDVWLGNYRGTPYGLRHKTLSPKSHEFWDFSWHENGVLDQAAMIDYILNITGRERLFAVSYSMSCTASMVLYSERPEYNSKVIANIFFAPSAFIKHPTGLWQLTKVTMKMFPGLTNLLKDATGNHIINDKLPFSDVSLTTICHVAKRNIILAPICTLLSEFFAGRHSPSAADRLLRGLTVRIPSGASIRQCVHYAQSIERGGEFRQYDFGRARNLELYGSSEPPSYNLQAVASPVHFFCGISDRTVSIKDCDTLTKTIPSTVSVNKVPRYQHHDFILGEGLDELVNTKVIAYLLSYL